MQLRHVATAAASSGSLAKKVGAVAVSPNGVKIAAVMDRVVYLYDSETGERRDKFSTKGSVKGAKKQYRVNDLTFSADSTMLAIAQSDNIVFIYRLGAGWDGEKKIIGKFGLKAAATALAWPGLHDNEVVFGVANGKVKVGKAATSKGSTLYNSGSYVVAAAAAPDGHSVATAHLDGSVFAFAFGDDGNISSPVRICQHPSVPACLAWGEHIAVASPDRKLFFYDPANGSVVQRFDYSRDDDATAAASIAMSPNGASLVVGSVDRVQVYNYQSRRQTWDETPAKAFEGLHTVTALAWNEDGSRLVLGSLCGAVELFDACLKRVRYGGAFDLTYIAPSQVKVTRLGSPTSTLVSSHAGAEITKINIFHDRFVVAFTPETLLLADLAERQLSEIPWMGGGGVGTSTGGTSTTTEKFNFDEPGVCMVFNAGELTLVEYGRNEIVGHCRTEFTNPHLVSVRLSPNPAGGQPVRMIAYLIDVQTIRVQDLNTGINVATVAHSDRLDWLELNRHGKYVLFRDKQRRLHLVNVATQERTTLLLFCSYVQWVPDTDVVIAQNRNVLCVWYNIESPDQVTTFTINGDVQTIERAGGKTDVIVNEGVREVRHTLDEGLLEFGAALEDHDFGRAIAMLETVEQTAETEAMWATLANLSLADAKLAIAERCYAALGDVPKARFLRRINEMARAIGAETGDDGYADYRVRAELALLGRRFREAEALYLEHGQVVEAMKMYQNIQNHEEAVRVAVENNYAQLAEYKASYFAWLTETGQYEKAAAVREREGDFLGAIDLCLQGGLPAKAALFVTTHNLALDSAVLERIAGALESAGLFGKAGEFFERLGVPDRAYEAYRKGHAYPRLIELARVHYHDRVVTLEEEFGDWLVSEKQVDAAIAHFNEAGKYMKALDAAMAARQFTKALRILEATNPPNAAPYWLELAAHFEGVRQYKKAEELYIKANEPERAVTMYTKIGDWNATRELVAYLPEPEIERLYLEQAKSYEAAGKLKDAERLYLFAKRPDFAITMFRNHERYNDMLRLVAKHHPELLAVTHLDLAQQLETEGRYREAEKHYVAGDDWKAAINMFRANDAWEDAYRVAKRHGGQAVANQVAFYWISTGNMPLNMAGKFGLVEPAIAYALEGNEFEFAYSLARANNKALLPDIHFKHAETLEDGGDFPGAEREFLAAGKPREAILMHLHAKDWANAARVAKAHDPSALVEVQLAQARIMVDEGQLGSAEQIFLRAERSDLAIKMYVASNEWDEAFRVCRQFAPDLLPQYQAEYARVVNAKGAADKEDLLATARTWEDQGAYSRAIDAYLQITAETTDDHDFLEEVWERSLVQLAHKFVPDRLAEVVDVVSQRLVEIGRIEAAAEIYAGVTMFREAIDVYLAAGRWDAASALADQRAPQLVDYVNNAVVEDRFKKGDGPALEAAGHVRKALDVYAKQGDWERCLTLARDQGADVLNHYLTARTEGLVQQGHYGAAAKLYARFPPAPNPNNFLLYKRIAKEILFDHSNEAAGDLRTMLYAVYEGLRNAAREPDPADVAVFDRLLRIAHLAWMKVEARRRGLPEVEAKAAAAMVRYAGDIPADKLFYEAGAACKETGDEDFAFIFWNRCVDLSDTIHDPDTSLLEADDFLNTDVPADLLIPDRPFLDRDQADELRNWLLQKSVDDDLSRDLPTEACDSCGTAVYAASLWCPQCDHEHEQCVVTGYPVRQRGAESGGAGACLSCHSPYRVKDWNRFVMAASTCPWCGSNASLAT